MPDPHRPSEPRRRAPSARPSPSDARLDLGVGELFKGLGNFLDLLGKMADEGESEVVRTGELKSPSGVKGVYGFSVKMGLGGKPTVEHFGNVRATERGPEVSPVREPLVDVFDEGDHILVVVELPGVAESDIRADAKDDILSVSAEARERTYAKEILLPVSVTPTTLRKTYQNGVLEIRLAKAIK